MVSVHIYAYLLVNLTCTCETYIFAVPDAPALDAKQKGTI